MLRVSNMSTVNKQSNSAAVSTPDASTSSSLKVAFKEEIRRVRVGPANKYEDLLDMCVQSWKGHRAGYSFTFTDEDGDMCRITRLAELEEAIRHVDPKVLKISVVYEEPLTIFSCAAEVVVEEEKKQDAPVIVASPVALVPASAAPVVVEKAPTPMGPWVSRRLLLEKMAPAPIAPQAPARWGKLFGLDFRKGDPEEIKEKEKEKKTQLPKSLSETTAALGTDDAFEMPSLQQTKKAVAAFYESFSASALTMDVAPIDRLKKVWAEKMEKVFRCMSFSHLARDDVMDVLMSFSLQVSSMSDYVDVGDGGEWTAFSKKEKKKGNKAAKAAVSASASAATTFKAGPAAAMTGRSQLDRLALIDNMIVSVENLFASFHAPDGKKLLPRSLHEFMKYLHFGPNGCGSGVLAESCVFKFLVYFVRTFQAEKKGSNKKTAADREEAADEVLTVTPKVQVMKIKKIAAAEEVSPVAGPVDFSAIDWRVKAKKASKKASKVEKAAKKAAAMDDDDALSASDDEIAVTACYTPAKEIYKTLKKAEKKRFQKEQAQQQQLPAHVEVAAGAVAADLSLDAESEEPEQSTMMAETVILNEKDGKYKSVFVCDATYFDRSSVEAGSSLIKTWVVRNEGKAAWPAGCSLVLLKGKILVDGQHPVPCALPNAEVHVSVHCSIPEKMRGRCNGCFRLARPDGTLFGQRLWLDVWVDKKKKHQRGNTSDSSDTDDSASARGTASSASVDVIPAAPWSKKELRQVEKRIREDGKFAEKLQEQERRELHRADKAKAKAEKHERVALLKQQLGSLQSELKVVKGRMKDMKTKRQQERKVSKKSSSASSSSSSASAPPPAPDAVQVAAAQLISHEKLLELEGMLQSLKTARKMLYTALEDQKLVRKVDKQKNKNKGLCGNVSGVIIGAMDGSDCASDDEKCDFDELIWMPKYPMKNGTSDVDAEEELHLLKMKAQAMPLEVEDLGERVADVTDKYKDIYADALSSVEVAAVAVAGDRVVENPVERSESAFAAETEAAVVVQDSEEKQCAYVAVVPSSTCAETAPTQAGENDSMLTSNQDHLVAADAAADADAAVSPSPCFPVCIESSDENLEIMTLSEANDVMHALASSSVVSSTISTVPTTAASSSVELEDIRAFDVPADCKNEEEKGEAQKDAGTVTVAVEESLCASAVLVPADATTAMEEDKASKPELTEEEDDDDDSDNDYEWVY